MLVLNKFLPSEQISIRVGEAKDIINVDFDFVIFRPTDDTYDSISIGFLNLPTNHIEVYKKRNELKEAYVEVESYGLISYKGLAKIL